MLAIRLILFIFSLTNVAFSQTKFKDKNIDSITSLFLMHKCNKAKINFCHDNYDGLLMPFYSMIKLDTPLLNSYSNGLYFAFFQDTIEILLSKYYDSILNKGSQIQFDLNNPILIKKLTNHYKVQKNDIKFSYILLKCKILYTDTFEMKFYIPNFNYKKVDKILFKPIIIKYRQITSINFYPLSENDVYIIDKNWKIKYSP